MSGRQHVSFRDRARFVPMVVALVEMRAPPMSVVGPGCAARLHHRPQGHIVMTDYTTYSDVLEGSCPPAETASAARADLEADAL